MLARIESLDPVLRAFITIDAERALARARRAAHTGVAGGDLGLIRGIPVAVTDERLLEDTQPQLVVLTNC